MTITCQFRWADYRAFVRRLPWRSLAFPLIVLGFFAALVAADLNGSSAAELAPDQAAARAYVIAGNPKALRSDEWRIQTPLAVQATRMGFPPNPLVGLNETDPAASPAAGPAAGWAALLKPQQWGYFLLGPSRGLAWSWWFQFAICAVGVYLAVLGLTRMRSLAIAGAFMAAFSPYTAWWTGPGLAIGFGALAIAAFLAAARTDSQPRSLGLGLLGGLSCAALWMMLYPPWAIAIYWIVAGTVLGFTLDNWRGWRRATLALAPGAAIAAAVLAVWYLSNRAAISAIAGTIYPGHRLATGGNDSLDWLASAPTSFWLALSNARMTSSNRSEISVPWLPVPLIIAAAAVALWVAMQRRTQRDLAADREQATVTTGLWTWVGVASATVVLTIWCLIPIPQVLGKVTLLDHVPGNRTVPAIGLGAILILMLAATATTRIRSSRTALIIIGVGALAAGVLGVSSRTAVPVDPAIFNPILLALSAFALALALAALLVARRKWIACAVVCGYCFSAWVLVNPLMAGLGPMQSDPIVVATQDELATHPNDVYVALGQADHDSGLTLDALVRSAGAASISGATFYPDWALMEQIAPGQEALWNNYNNYVWLSDPGVADFLLVEERPTVVAVHANLCAPKFRALGVTVVVSDSPLNGVACALPIGVVARGSRQVFRYRIQ